MSMEASLLALEDRGKGRRSCGLTRTAIIVAACPALLGGGVLVEGAHLLESSL